MYRLIVPLVLAALCSLNLTGCSGIGVSAELYRIDERSDQTTTKQVPFKCLFVSCSGEGQNHGS